MNLDAPLKVCLDELKAAYLMEFQDHGFGMKPELEQVAKQMAKCWCGLALMMCADCDEISFRFDWTNPYQGEEKQEEFAAWMLDWLATLQERIGDSIQP